jgi:hypothetical protein
MERGPCSGKFRKGSSMNSYPVAPAIHFKGKLDRIDQRNLRGEADIVALGNHGNRIPMAYRNCLDDLANGRREAMHQDWLESMLRNAGAAVKIDGGFGPAGRNAACRKRSTEPFSAYGNAVRV